MDKPKINAVFNIAKVKPARVKVSKEDLGEVFALALKTNIGWIARIKRKNNIGGYDTIQCKFTEKSFDITGRKEVFREDVINGKKAIVMWIRDAYERLINKGVNSYCTFRHEGIYAGKLYNIAGTYYFDAKYYVGHINKEGKIIIYDDYFDCESIHV